MKINPQSTEIRLSSHLMDAEGSEYFKPTEELIKDFVLARGYIAYDIDISFDSIHGVWRWGCYLKPVEAQQSEGVFIKQEADDIFGKEPSGPKLHWTIGFQDGSEWRAEQYTARITALQQDVERLKEAQRWIPVTERLPPDDEQVEVMTKTVGADIATLLYESYDNTYEWDKYEWSHVSHWRFLPEPPTK